MDLDEWTTRDELNEAVASAAGPDDASARVVSVRRRYGGTQVARVTATPETINRLVSSDRIWVSCRVRQAETRPTCFRCLAYGLMAKACTGPDRSDCCRRCGAKGHKAAGYVASNDFAKEFMKLVGTEDKRDVKAHLNAPKETSSNPL